MQGIDNKGYIVLVFQLLGEQNGCGTAIKGNNISITYQLARLVNDRKLTALVLLESQGEDGILM